MGTGTIEEAMHWVEFCNSTGNTYYANLRRKLGYEEPFRVKYWGLGNEMFGGWQLGFLTAEQYAQKAVEFGKAMKWVDPSIELIACGYELDSEWNCTVIRYLKKLVNYISAHHYSTGWGIFDSENYEECMYIPEYLNKMTDIMRAGIVAGSNDALTEIKIAWDEWNVNGWQFDGVDEDTSYTLQNAILTAAILHTFIRRSDVIGMANYSPFVNISGAVSVHPDRVVKRAQYSVFQLFANHMGKEYLDSHTECEGFRLEEKIDETGRRPEARLNLNGEEKRRTVWTPYIDAVATYDKQNREIILSFVNKHPEKECEIEINILGKKFYPERITGYTIYHENLCAANTMENPDQISVKQEEIDLSHKKIKIKKHSVCLVRIKADM